MKDRNSPPAVNQEQALHPAFEREMASAEVKATMDEHMVMISISFDPIRSTITSYPSHDIRVASDSLYLING